MACEACNVLLREHAHTARRLTHYSRIALCSVLGRSFSCGTSASPRGRSQAARCCLTSCCTASRRFTRSPSQPTVTPSSSVQARIARCTSCATPDCMPSSSRTYSLRSPLCCATFARLTIRRRIKRSTAHRHHDSPPMCCLPRCRCRRPHELFSGPRGRLRRPLWSLELSPDSAARLTYV